LACQYRSAVGWQAMQVRLAQRTIIMKLGNGAAPSTPSKRSVLILEDEPLIAAMIQELVEELGCRVVGPAHGVDRASQLIAHEAIDFAILDIIIEGVSSYAIAEELKRRQIPFVFTTGYDRGEIDKSFGCPVITKPFDPGFLQGVTAGQLGLPMPGGRL